MRQKFKAVHEKIFVSSFDFSYTGSH